MITNFCKSGYYNCLQYSVTSELLGSKSLPIYSDYSFLRGCRFYCFHFYTKLQLRSCFPVRNIWQLSSSSSSATTVEVDRCERDASASTTTTTTSTTAAAELQSVCQCVRPGYRSEHCNGQKGWGRLSSFPTQGKVRSPFHPYINVLWTCVRNFDVGYNL